MTIAIFGATGFLGKNLARHVLDSTDWTVRAVCRNPRKLDGLFDSDDRLTVTQGDVLQIDSIKRQLEAVDVAFYFVHMMGHAGINFYDTEILAAQNFVAAANASGVRRIVFMGGLGNNEPGQSMHLASRHRTGELLRSARCQVVELRASMIIGNGSVAYDMITSVARRMPIMLLPKSTSTRTQPIALRDALNYLVAAATVPLDTSRIIEIGGPDAVTYAAVYRRYLWFIGRHRPIITVPYIPRFMSSLFLDVMTPKIHARIGREMVDSMTSEMVVTNHDASQLFPDIHPVPLEQAFAVAA